jgi:ADP-heptose:LPS heptosyltransferase
MSEKLLFAANLLVSKFWKGKVSPEKIEEIVCVKWDEIGDMVTAVHVFRLLKAYAPHARLTVLCKPFVGSLLHAETSIDQLVFDIKELPKKADVWVELRGTWKTWWWSIFRTKRVRLDRGTIRFKQRGHQPHERITNFRIIEPLVGAIDWRFEPLKCSISDRECTHSLIEKWNVSHFFVVHPGGRSLLRRWNPDKYVEVIKHIHNKNQWVALVIGTEEEREIIEYIVQKSQGAAVAWVSHAPLGVLASVLLKAELFLGNESGPLQIADAMGIRSIGLFGPGVKEVFYPQTEGSTVLHHVLPCNPCDQITCVRPDYTCMDRIEVLQVVANL